MKWNRLNPKGRMCRSAQCLKMEKGLNSDK